MFGKKVLTKKDQKHLRENKIFTKYQFEEQIKFLKSEMKKRENRTICYDCLHIAKKLNMWGE